MGRNGRERERLLLTFRGALEAHKELLPVSSVVSVSGPLSVGGVAVVVGSVGLTLKETIVSHGLESGSVDRGPYCCR